MYNREFSRMGSVDMRELLDDAWTEFEATSPDGIDLIAEASLRNMIAARLMRAAKAGETDRATLKALAEWSLSPTAPIRLVNQRAPRRACCSNTRARSGGGVNRPSTVSLGNDGAPE
jgi:hypothetical protein